MIMLGTDMKVAEAPKDGLKDYTKVDPYAEWLKKEGVKVYEEFYFPSLAKIELGPWPRKGGNGAVIHIANRHIPNDCHVVEIKPKGKSEPEHHMYELTIYVVSGHGATTIWQNGKDEKRRQSFEWHAGSLFCIPLNVCYQNFNGSGDEPVRYIAVTNAPPMMRLFGDNEFIFNCDYIFSARYSGEEDYFSGKGKLFTRRIWESNFIANAPDMPLYGWKERGAGGINAMLEMANNNMKNHISEFPVGTYKKAHRHGPGPHLVLLSGTAGYSLLWTKEDRSDMIKCDWQVGSMVIIPGDNCFHQHFNSGSTRARYLALRSGDMGLETPRGGGGEGADRSLKEGGWQIEYEDEDREIHEIFEKELVAHGARCKMKAFVPWCTGEVGPTSERDT
ncbi:MAG: ethanolamine ammonia lyase-activating protein [Deltaproteobacteria bacterium]|nr:ethanolamine ammonia lyase-activating protein [Deltaproteobacteria bacterium]